MNYYLSSSKDDRIEFSLTKSAGCLVKAFLMVGLLMVATGTIVFYFDQKDGEWGWVGPMIATAGATFTLGGWLFSKLRHLDPKLIVFDDRKGLVIISQDERLKQTASIPYQEVKEFKIKKVKSGATSSSTVDTGYWHVYFLTVDGRVFYLDSFKSQEKALAQFNYLASMVDLKKKGEEIMPATPSLLTLSRNGGTIVVQWKNPFVYFHAFFLLILGGIGGSGYLFRNAFEQAGGSFALFFYIFFGIIGVTFIVFMVNVIRQWGSIHTIEIDKESFRYFRLKDSVRKSEKTIPLEEIRAIGSNFESSVGGTDVCIVDIQSFDLQEKVESNTASFKERLSGMVGRSKTIKLQLPLLSAVDKLNLSKILRMLVREVGGKNIL